MIRVKILRGLDLDPNDAELYLTLSVGPLSKTSRVTKKFTGSNKENAEAEDTTVSQRNLSLTGGWVWDEELELRLPQEEASAGEEDVEMVVECFNTAREFQSQGRVSIPLSRLSRDEPVQQWYALGENKGSVLLNLTLLSAPLATPPPAPAGPTQASTNGNKLDVSAWLPMGLADYFVVAGARPDTMRQERLKMLTRSKRRGEEQEQDLGDDGMSQAALVGQDGVTLSPLLLERYPAKDRADIEFPTKCEMFLLPDGVEILSQAPPAQQEQRHFTFILVNNNVKLFGFCLQVWSALPVTSATSDGLEDNGLDTEPLFAPTVYCYLTRLPLAQEKFQNILEATLAARCNGTFFRVLRRVLWEVPTPLPGLFSVEFTLGGSNKLATAASLPDFSTKLPPLIYPDLCSHLFGWFRVEDVIRLWIAALTEQKILLHSRNRDTLAKLSESLVQLMYPFKWENGFIPVLPTSLMQIFDAPIPVILGLRTDALERIPDMAQIRETFIQVDADKCEITFPPQSLGEHADRLPKELEVRLFRMIRHAQQLSGAAGVERRDVLIRFAFVECLASLLQGYRECFFSLNTGADAGTVFNKAQFFLHQTAQRAQLSSTLAQLFAPNGGRALSPIPAKDQSFLNHFFETTAFERFKVSQHDPENELFHQVYRTRRARERERDQRLGSLAGLQSDAAPPLLRVWQARVARWDYKSLEPIEPPPPSATAAAELEGQGVLHLQCTAPLLHVGDRVRCGVFGEGTILALTARGDDELIVQVQLAYARGFFPISTLELISSDASECEPSSEDAFRQVFVPQVNASCTKQQFKKAYAQYRRTVGGGGDSTGSNSTTTSNLISMGSNNNARRQTKTPLENKVERLLIRTITNIFQDKSVGEADIRECQTYLGEPFARNTLMQVLRSQHSDSTWLATPGRGRRLGEEAFAALYSLVDALLLSCALGEDFSNGRTVLDVSPFFYCGEETLQNRLKNHVLWSKLMFWEYAFAESLVEWSTAAAANTTTNASILMEDAAPNAGSTASTHKSLAQLQELAQSSPHPLPLFEQLSVFVHNMLNLNVPEDMARAFVDRVATIFPNLDADHKATLNMLITNICKSMSYYEEEQEMDGGQAGGADSPNSASSPGSNMQRRGSVHNAAPSTGTTGAATGSARKRSGMDVMFSRFSSTWRKAATVAVPVKPNATATTPGRRDSMT